MSTSDYQTLSAGLVIPSANPIGSAGVATVNNFKLIDKAIGGYVHEQVLPAAVWTITHNLGKPVSLTVTDTAGTVIQCDERIIDLDTVEVSFFGAGVPMAMLGKVYVI